MNIRPAVKEDIDKAIVLFKEFEAESLAEYGFHVSVEHIKTIANELVDTSLVLEIDNNVAGVIVLKLYDDLLGGSKVAHEIVWYVSEKHRRYGIRLLKAAEQWCIDAGVSKLIMIHMANSKADKLSKFYQMCGYVPLETHYIKQLGD